MKIYWSIKSIPELKEMPEEERKAIFRQCSAKVTHNWKTSILIGLCCLCAGFGIALGRKVGNIIGAMIAAVLGGAIIGFILLQVVIRKTLPYIRKELDSRKASGTANEQQ